MIERSRLYEIIGSKIEFTIENIKSFNTKKYYVEFSSNSLEIGHGDLNMSLLLHKRIHQNVT